MKFAEIATKYSELTPLRVVLTNIVPVFGASIDLALSNYAEDIYKKRIEKALDNLQNEIKVLKNHPLDQEYFKSETFFDIFRLYLEKSIRTRQNEKIQYYAKLLTDAIKFPEKTEQTEQDIEKISTLSVRDMKIMKQMYEDNLRDSNLFGNPDDFVEGTLSMKQIPNNLPEVNDLSKSEVEEDRKSVV